MVDRSIRTRLSRAARQVRVLGPVLARTAVATASEAVDRVRPDRAGDSAEEGVPQPSGAADFARRVHAERSVPASVGAVVGVLTDLDRWHEWVTMHLSWRGERPSTLRGDAADFRQQISLMDIPAQVTWRVARVDDTGFELRGTGPMGITVGLWATVAASTGAGAGSVVRMDGALDGPPVRGPVGLTAVRSVETALRDSLRRLADLLAGGAAVRISHEPVRHERTGAMLDPSTPVLVGVGQVVRRPGEPPVEPVVLAERALRAAVADSGDHGVDLAARADLVYAVPSASWTYPDQAGLLASRLGCRDGDGERPATVQTSPYGGDGGQLAINDAAQQVADGQAHVVLVAGAEAGAAIAELQAGGKDPDWTRQPDGAAPDRVIGIDKQANNEAETSVGLGAPIHAYALIESALRRVSGLGRAEHTARIAGLWSRLSEVAVGNPYAWDRSPRTPEQIGEPSTDNRMVAEPYTKLMCANLQVDLGAGVVVTSVAAAHAFGIDQSRWVFLHAGASAVDEWFVSERATLTESPAIAAAGAAVLDHAGIGVADLGPVDLYSCFPAAVQIGAAALGLPVDDPERSLSVTGGLTFAGGPGNAYGLHAVATMVPMLRERPEEYGLSSSLGWYATKHSLGVYAARPPARRFAHLQPMVERPAPRPVSTELPEDGGVVEAVTVGHARDGSVEGAIVSVVTDDGTRVLLRRESAEDVALLTTGDPLGRRLAVVEAPFEARLRLAPQEPSPVVEEPLEARLRLAPQEPRGTSVSKPTEGLPPPPDPPLRVTRAGAHDDIAVLTLNRPAQRNAVDHQMAVMLERAVDDAEADASVRVIVLTGAGGTFCAGVDLSDADRGEVPVTDRRGPLGLTAEPPTKPTIAAVEGAALGGGFELVLCADLVVAGESATFGLQTLDGDRSSESDALLRAAEALPEAVALEMAMTGGTLRAARLHQLGSVNRVVADGDGLESAIELGEAVVANLRPGVLLGKRIMRVSSRWDADPLVGP